MVQHPNFQTKMVYSSVWKQQLVGLHTPWKIKKSPKLKLQGQRLYHLILRLTEGTHCHVLGNKYVFEYKTPLHFFLLFFLVLLNNFQPLYKKKKILEKIIKIEILETIYNRHQFYPNLVF